VTCEGLFLPRIATWKNPLNNIYTLMSRVVVVLLCVHAKDSTPICMKQFVKATHHCGPQGVWRGGVGLFCKDGAMTLVNELSVHFPLN
jgi:hypothetical protein